MAKERRALMELKGVEIEWTGHAGFLVRGENILVSVDPFKLAERHARRKADIILVTHSHHDHCSAEDIGKIAAGRSILVCPPDCFEKAGSVGKGLDARGIRPGMELELEGIRVRAVPAYNIEKRFHPEREGWVGYLLDIGGVKIYHAGDTDFLPEMKELAGERIDAVLLPVGGKYTMDAAEAAECASVLKPAAAVPMHYGTVVGSLEDAERFGKLCGEKNVGVEILC